MKNAQKKAHKSIVDKRVAHHKYEFWFDRLGDNPSKEELEELLNAIHEAILSGELTEKNCKPEEVDQLQYLIVYALNGGKYFGFWREYYYWPPVPRNLQSRELYIRPKSILEFME